ncbi:MAG: nicotinate-nicotinamide nucleotide adenylyltransferase, partial [Vicinamibacterales bacterium]
MAAGRRVGVMGGTFDPIHGGHVDLGRAAVTALNLTELLVLPSSVPPHRPQPHASSHHRFAMAAMTVSRETSWRVSDLEFESPGPSYTTTTLDRLKDAGYSPDELFFVIGADAFAEVETWRNYPGLLDQANVAVVSRPGWRVSSLPAR